MDKTLVLEISSDEEVGFDDSSTADCFDWVSKLLNDPDDLNCSKNNGVVDLDDVVVVGEVVAKPKRGKISVPKSRNFDDDDCVVLDCDPDKEVAAEMKGYDVDSDDLVIVGEKGQVACRDYPHSRHLCAKFPFSSTPHENCCNLCHCYVCDSLAPCAYWGSGVSDIDHCHATDKVVFWQQERKKLRQSKRTPVPITKPPIAAVAGHPRPEQIRARLAHPVPTAVSTSGFSSSPGIPNIISQGRGPRPGIAVARNGYQPRQGCHQFLRTCNSNIMRSRGSTLAPGLVSSRPIFKRSGFTAKPVEASKYRQCSLNNASVMNSQSLQLMNHQLAGQSFKNNSTTLARSSPPLNVNVSSSQRTLNCVSTNGLPSQSSGYNPPHGHAPTLLSQRCGIPGDLAYDSPYVYTSVDPAPYVSSSIAVDGVAQSGAHSGPFFGCDTSNGPSQQSSEATANICNPNFFSHTSNSLNSIPMNCQQPSAENSQIPDVAQQNVNPAESIALDSQQTLAPNLLAHEAPRLERLPFLDSNSRLSSTTNPETLDFDLDSWLSDTEPIFGEQGSYLCDMNNQQPVTAPVDAGMLYFDFETSWKGLTHS